MRDLIQGRSTERIEKRKLSIILRLVSKVHTRSYFNHEKGWEGLNASRETAEVVRLSPDRTITQNVSNFTVSDLKRLHCFSNS